MGSRAIVVVCEDEAAAARRFAPDTPGAGAIYTRTGRPFLDDPSDEVELLSRVRKSLTSTGLWKELSTDWVVLDCELLPWSAKAVGLLREQYAAVGSAGIGTLDAEQRLLECASVRGVDVTSLSESTTSRLVDVRLFVDAYRRYCWSVSSLDDLKLAPFQILAGESEVFALRDHRWHLEVLGRLAAVDVTTFRTTQHIVVELADADSMTDGIRWWDELTAVGGEGMVVKPVEVAVQGERGLVQPGIKCRAREYLRIIYGPEYTEPRNLRRLKRRGLGHKRSLAQREFALGIEALERLVANEPLYRVHECTFGVLALESEPVDPRL